MVTPEANEVSAAETALLALGDTLEWQEDTSLTQFDGTVMPCVSAVLGSEMRYWLTLEKEYRQWRVHHAQTFHMTVDQVAQSAWRKTLPAAKAACIHHLITGCWDPQATKLPLAWINHHLPTVDNRVLVATAIGRDINYRIFQSRRLFFFRQWEVCSTYHQCAYHAGKPVTLLHKHDSSELGVCQQPDEYRVYSSLADAQASCQNHHAAGVWQTPLEIITRASTVLLPFQGALTARRNRYYSRYG